LKLQSGNEAAITVQLANTAILDQSANLAFSTKTADCTTDGQVLKETRANPSFLIPTFQPTKGAKMVLSAWVKEAQQCDGNTYVNNSIGLYFDGGASAVICSPSGVIVEGWQRYEVVFDVPAGSTNMTISLKSLNGATVYFDDLRLHPFNANLKSFVYNSLNMRLMAELDENNYATFYEYDDEGTLIRLKKETVRGIQTIKETRSALKKN
jgi:hypothetical protein